MNKNIGIIGLGLIGGSFAQAFKQYTGHTIYGFDTDSQTIADALDKKAIDYKLDKNSYSLCDIIIVALYPNDTKNFILENIESFKKGVVVIDCAGTKENICNKLSEPCSENGIYFIGGHPMAGREKWGFSFSTGELFKDASMILCKDKNTNAVALKQVEMLFMSIGFGRVTITTAAEHDKMIAFTSQLAHVVSSAYIKSKTALMQDGFSAGSFKDLTRVAKLNESMWTELFFENKSNLLAELDGIINRLNEYKSALNEDDHEKMQQLLLEGRLAKERTEWVKK